MQKWPPPCKHGIRATIEQPWIDIGLASGDKILGHQSNAAEKHYARKTVSK